MDDAELRRENIDRAMNNVAQRSFCSHCGSEIGYAKHHSWCPFSQGMLDPDSIRHELGAIPGVHNIEVAIPPEVAQYAPDIQRFVDAMVYKLARNAHKGRWEDRGQAANMGLLQKEVVELTEAINRGNMVEIMLEAADVANFALIASAIAMDKK